MALMMAGWNIGHTQAALLYYKGAMVNDAEKLDPHSGNYLMPAMSYFKDNLCDPEYQK